MVRLRVDSTNAQARRILARLPAGSERAPVVVVAWSQSRGSGRRGRVWESGPGEGAWVTLLEPSLAADRIARLPILLPVALCRALRALGVERCGLRWPNDLMVDGSKLGGVLIEAVTSGERPSAAVMGFGVNYVAPERRRVPRPTVGVRELLPAAPTLGEMTLRLATEVLAAVAEPPAEPPGELSAEYRRLLVHEDGEPLAFVLAGETVEGSFAGLDERGFLRLRAGGEVRTIPSGDLIEV